MVSCNQMGLNIDFLEHLLRAETDSENPFVKGKRELMRLVAPVVAEKCQATSGGPTRVLDAGCAIGGDLRILASLLADAHVAYYGVDIMPALIEAIQVRSLGPVGANYVCGDIHVLPFEANTFDVVYCSRVLIHSDLEQAVSELIRVQKSTAVGFAVEGDVSASSQLFLTSDERVREVDRQKSLSTMRAVKNPQAASQTFWTLKKLEVAGIVSNVRMDLQSFVITDAAVIDPGFAMTSQHICKLVSDLKISQVDADHYLEALHKGDSGDPYQIILLSIISWIKV